MKNLVALLRGINVSGQKKIVMADLRQSLEKEGYENVRTYIQSGNIVFESEESNPVSLAQKIEKIIQNDFGFEVPTLVISQESIRKIPDSNPFLKPGQETKALYVGFMYEEPDERHVQALYEAPTQPDEFSLAYPFVFMKFSDGIGKSKMDNNFFERKLKIKMTSRNWNTILKLSDM